TNREFLSILSDGFIQRRDDPSKKDLYIQLINFEQPEANIFRVVNQLEVKQYQRRIPDAVAFINGLPVVVFEFKNPVNDGADTHEAYKQVTVRYRRDIPKLLGYNVFTVLSDGVNSKYGSVFAPYKFFNTWRQVEAGDPEVEGVDAFYALLEGLMRKDRLVALIKNFVFFPDALKQDDETKIIARPPQFFAATKLIENIKAHIPSAKTGGTVNGGAFMRRSS
ncbi:type I restriction endonuclease, partial [Olsenella sp. AGMB03486]|uniref:type I restriction endonuclease n=1 Tax=Olsenella sp. AGMB03486 TaxID=3230364 RepID=UPI0034A0A37B